MSTQAGDFERAAYASAFLLARATELKELRRARAVLDALIERAESDIRFEMTNVEKPRYSIQFAPLKIELLKRYRTFCECSDHEPMEPWKCPKARRGEAVHLQSIEDLREVHIIDYTVPGQLRNPI